MLKEIKLFCHQLWFSAKNGLFDSVAESFNPHYDAQERLRLEVARKASDPNWSDDDVWETFQEYCLRYDKRIRLNRTRQILNIILEERPAIAGRYLDRRPDAPTRPGNIV